MNARHKTEERLSAYLDGQLNPAQAELLERAVAEDEQLARRLAELREVRRLVRGMPRQHAPEDFVSNVLVRAERAHLVLSHPAEERDFSWARHLATAAVVLLAIGIGGVVCVTLWHTAKMPKIQTASLKSDAARDSWLKDVKVDETAGAMDIKDVNGDQVTVNNVDIYTDNLADTRKEVEKALHSNNLKLLTRDKAVKDAVVVNGSLNNNAFGNYYNAQQLDGKQVRILAYVNDVQVPALETTLDNIRSQQRVSQAPAEQTYLAKGEASGYEYQAAPRAMVGKASKGGGSSEGARPDAPKSDERFAQNINEQAKTDQSAVQPPPSPIQGQGDSSVPPGWYAAHRQEASQSTNEQAQLALPAAGTPPATQPSSHTADGETIAKFGSNGQSVVVSAGNLTIATSAPADSSLGLSQMAAPKPVVGGSAGVNAAPANVSGVSGANTFVANAPTSQPAAAGQSLAGIANQSQYLGDQSQRFAQATNQSQQNYSRRMVISNATQRQNVSGNNQAVLITINLRPQVANSSGPATQTQPAK